MLPHHIILAIFTALLSQGNVASALPRGQFQTRGEYVDGKRSTDVIDARDSIPELQVRTDSTSNVGSNVAEKPTKRAPTPSVEDLEAAETGISSLKATAATLNDVAECIEAIERIAYSSVKTAGLTAGTLYGGYYLLTTKVINIYPLNALCTY